MRPLRFVSFRSVLPALALGALLTGVGCEKDEPPEFTPQPGPSGGQQGTRPDGGSTTDGGDVQQASARPLLRLLPPAGSYSAEARVQLGGSQVASASSGLASSGHVVTAAALGGDGVALVGVKEFGSNTAYETSVRAGATEAEIQTAAAALGDSGHVVTAVAPGASDFSLVGVKERNATDKVGARVRKVSAVSQVYAAANELGGAGYGVTALAKGQGGYVLVGTQVSGGSGAYAASTRLVQASELQAAVTALASDGHVITGLTYDNDNALVLGIKPAGATRTYSATVLETSSAGMFSNVSYLASQGYMVTAMGYNGTNFVLIGLR